MLYVKTQAFLPRSEWTVCAVHNYVEADIGAAAAKANNVRKADLCRRSYCSCSILSLLRQPESRYATHLAKSVIHKC
ncbi:MAG: hypothetical protein ABJM43_05020 [Paracoccaceae bacterium]